MSSHNIPEINKDELVNLAQQLIRIPSINPPGEEVLVIDFLVDYLKNIGMDVEIEKTQDGRPNVIATWRGKSDHPRLLFNGHLDVVPPCEGWSLDPFSGEIRNGQIYGLGSVDMKGPLAAMIAAIKTLIEQNFVPSGTIILAAVSDEEVGQKGIRHLRNINLNADYALVGEPTNLEVAVAHKGRVIVEITTRGRSAHAALAEQGVNAIERMLPIMRKLVEKSQERNKPIHPLLGDSRMTITTINGGNAINSVPDKCSITIDCRILPDETEQSVVETINDILKSETDESQELQPVIKLLQVSPAMDCGAEMPIVKALRKSVEKITGGYPEVYGMRATCDAGVLATEFGIPSVIFGPGELDQAHKPNEHIDINQLELSAQVYALTIKELMI